MPSPGAAFCPPPAVSSGKPGDALQRLWIG
jgi:hypothetical protein